MRIFKFILRIRIRRRKKRRKIKHNKGLPAIYENLKAESRNIIRKYSE